MHQMLHLVELTHMLLHNQWEIRTTAADYDQYYYLESVVGGRRAVNAIVSNYIPIQMMVQQVT